MKLDLATVDRQLCTVRLRLVDPATHAPCAGVRVAINDSQSMSQGAPTEPTVNPAVATPNTSDSAERVMPSSCSSGRSSTLKA